MLPQPSLPHGRPDCVFVRRTSPVPCQGDRRLDLPGLRDKQMITALAAALFTPRVRTGFSATPRPGVEYPAADPLTGYDYLAHLHVSLPHFIAGRSRLLVQLWQADVEWVRFAV